MANRRKSKKSRRTTKRRARRTEAETPMVDHGTLSASEGGEPERMTITQRLHAAESARDAAIESGNQRVADMADQVQRLQTANNEALARMQKNFTTAQLEINHLRMMLTRLAHGGVHIEGMTQI